MKLARNMKLIGGVDQAELETLQKRVAAIVADLRLIRDDETVRELQKNA